MRIASLERIMNVSSRVLSQHPSLYEPDLQKDSLSSLIPSSMHFRSKHRMREDCTTSFKVISLVAWTMFQFQYFCMSVCTVCCWAVWALRKQELPLIHWTFTLSFASMSIDDPLPKRVLSVVIEVKACTLNRWRIRRALSFHRPLD